MGTNNKSYTKCYICFWFNNPELHLQISLVYITCIVHHICFKSTQFNHFRLYVLFTTAIINRLNSNMFFNRYQTNKEKGSLQKTPFKL